MVDTTNRWTGKPREIFYYRQRFKNRVFNRLSSFFAQESERSGITKREIAERLGKDPAQITRWLSGPGNVTIDTLSDLLFAMGAEPEPPQIVRFADRPKPNYVDPLIAEIMGEQRGSSVPLLGARLTADVAAGTPKIDTNTTSSSAA